ncbi:pyrroline-5-carboxylate reductase [Thermoproteota archaeon]
MKPQDIRIGFIGFGKMAESIWKGISAANLADSQSCAFTDIDESRKNLAQNTYNLRFQPLAELVAQSTVILIAVKPQNIKELLINFPKIELSNKVIISIAAGIPAAVFENYLDKTVQIARVMPNTPACIGEGMSCLSFNSQCTSENIKYCKSIFKSLGEMIVIPEVHMDTVTGISGSGPAFFYRIAEAVTDLGQELGLTYEQAITITAQTLAGAGKMMLKSGKSPQELISDVASPNGTTSAGLEIFNTTQIESDIKRVIKSAIARAKELSL